jgi:hypothetical protein
VLLHFGRTVYQSYSNSVCALWNGPQPGLGRGRGWLCSSRWPWTFCHSPSLRKSSITDVTATIHQVHTASRGPGGFIRTALPSTYASARTHLHSPFNPLFPHTRCPRQTLRPSSKTEMARTDIRADLRTRSESLVSSTSLRANRGGFNPTGSSSSAHGRTSCLCLSP